MLQDNVRNLGDRICLNRFLQLGPAVITTTAFSAWDVRLDIWSVSMDDPFTKDALGALRLMKEGRFACLRYSIPSLFTSFYEREQGKRSIRLSNGSVEADKEKSGYAAISIMAYSV
uniref:Solute carrier organic anion transporter family member n=1 Tax=Parascaris univalens TaxID=6257 RepID=A0A915BN02_PARUN